MNSGYHSTAKQLWSQVARETLHSQLQRQSGEVQLPPAVHEGWLCTEGAPDSYTARDATSSTLPIRALQAQPEGSSEIATPKEAVMKLNRDSIARRSRACGGLFVLEDVVPPGDSGGQDGGATSGSAPQVLTLNTHGRKEEVLTKPPAHLQTYTSDWVGLPEMPLNDMARLRFHTPGHPAGISKRALQQMSRTEMQANRMVEARQAREHELQRLQLVQVLQQRQAQRQLRAKRAMWREGLQIAAGQLRGQTDLLFTPLHCCTWSSCVGDTTCLD